LYKKENKRQTTRKGYKATRPKTKNSSDHIALSPHTEGFLDPLLGLDANQAKLFSESMLPINNIDLTIIKDH
jgi:hypothetical protein